MKPHGFLASKHNITLFQHAAWQWDLIQWLLKRKGKDCKLGKRKYFGMGITYELYDDSLSNSSNGNIGLD